MNIRKFDPSIDERAAERIWHEVGWVDPEKKEHKQGLGRFIRSGSGLVAEVDGAPECLALSASGSMRYLDDEIPLSAVIAVTTSRVARRLGIAGKLTAALVERDAREGAHLSTLGIFDQGYYDRLGYGTGVYHHQVRFDPADLRSDLEARVPVRITVDDWEEVHACRLARLRNHGSCSIDDASFTQAEMLFADGGFGLGYRDGPGGKLSHHFWCEAPEPEHGPYRIFWMAYETYAQFLELLGLLRGLGDQVRLVSLLEPPGIRMQDLLERPFRRRRVSEKGKFETGIQMFAHIQSRICDLPACLERTRLAGGPLRFTLRLVDPIESFLPEDSAWRGVGGDYVVTLGGSSGAERGSDRSLPLLRASVGAFTRMWLGVLPATSLVASDTLDAPRSLLEELDVLLRLPPPMPDFSY